MDNGIRMIDHELSTTTREAMVDRREKAAEAGSGRRLAVLLRDLIGRRVRYRGDLFEVFEILEHDPPALILRNDAHLRIQPDQHGDAHRRAPETVTVPVVLLESGLDLSEMQIELVGRR